MSTKILYIANIRLPTEKAHGIQIMKMCEAFAEHGAEVTLVVPWRFNPITKDPFDYYAVKKIFTITKVPSLDLVSLGAVGFWIQALSFAEVASWYALFKKSDIIYSRDELVLWFLALLKRNLVWEAHTPRFNAIIASVVRHTRRIVVISGGLKFFFTEKGVPAESILVAHDGVDMEQFAPIDMTQAREKLHLPRDKKIVGYVGKYKTMGKPKGVDELIEAFATVSEKDSEALLLLVGINEEEKKEVEEKLQRAGLKEESYRVISHVPQYDIPRYLSSTNVLVMNYPDAEHYALYMSPLKLFEYMAAKRPIIATDLPVVREVLNEASALLILPDNTAALASALEEALQNGEAGRARAEEARKEVEKYSWDARAKNILSFSIGESTS